MDRITEEWFVRRTWQEPAWAVDDLVAAKAGRRVSVVLPALDEEATVGAIVAAIVPLTLGPRPLVDELVVADSGSTDRTAEVAAAAGATVVLRTDVLPDLTPVPGKGEVLWRSLAATTGDIICYLDSDLVDFDASFVPALLGPLLTERGVALVKGFYRRPLRLETTEVDSGGGRSPSSWCGRCSLRCDRSSPVSSNRWAGSTPVRGSCSSPCRSPPGTAWRSGCCSTPTPRQASMRWRR
jgi:glucosyl-3-phosphoglycerate synthase